jgi:hypothetical protein
MKIIHKQDKPLRFKKNNLLFRLVLKQYQNQNKVVSLLLQAVHGCEDKYYRETMYSLNKKSEILNVKKGKYKN